MEAGQVSRHTRQLATDLAHLPGQARQSTGILTYQKTVDQINQRKAKEQPGQELDLRPPAREEFVQQLSLNYQQSVNSHARYLFNAAVSFIAMAFLEHLYGGNLNGLLKFVFMVATGVFGVTFIAARSLNTPEKINTHANELVAIGRRLEQEQANNIN